MSSSSNHSSSIPLSFDRFRVRSMQFLSPFRNHQNDKHIKKSPERSWIRKIQVHPNNVNSSESERITHDAAYLFHANKQSNSKISSLSKDPQDKKYPNHFFNTQSTSNVIGVLDLYKVSVANKSQSEVPECIYAPTPCMIGYRHSSLPTIVPIRVIKRPNSFDDSIKQSDFDHIDQLNA